MQVRESKRKLTEFLNSTDDVGGIQTSKEEKKTIPSYMNDRVYKLQNGSEISEMQKELYYELPKNETAMLQLALLLKNRNEDGTFNFTAIANTVGTKITKDIKKEIRRGNSSKPGSTEGKYRRSKSLASYFSTNKTSN